MTTYFIGPDGKLPLTSIDEIIFPPIGTQFKMSGHGNLVVASYEIISGRHDNQAYVRVYLSYP